MPVKHFPAAFLQYNLSEEVRRHHPPNDLASRCDLPVDLCVLLHRLEPEPAQRRRGVDHADVVLVLEEAVLGLPLGDEGDVGALLKGIKINS